MNIVGSLLDTAVRGSRLEQKRGFLTLPVHALIVLSVDFLNYFALSALESGDRSQAYLTIISKNS